MRGGIESERGDRERERELKDKKKQQGEIGERI